jgi:adenine-specific DNA methylase
MWIEKMSSHNLTGKESIQAFVQNVLHCECPPEVFSYISMAENYTIYGHKKTPITISNRINIGHRLLVYFIELNSDESIQVAETRFHEILEYGKLERDSAQFNRFRLALVATLIPSASIEAKFQSLFSAFLRQIGDDLKIHLHFV